MTNSTTPPPSADPRTPSERRRPRSIGLRAKRLSLGALSLSFLLAAALFYVIQFESGSAVLWRLATQMLPGTLSGTYVSGTVMTGMHLRNVKYVAGKISVDIDDVEGRWSLARSPLALSVAYLHIGIVNVRLSDAASEKTPLPSDLRLPLALKINTLTLAELNLRQGLSVSTFHNLRAHGESDGTQHAVVLEHLQTPYGETSAILHLNGTKPFALRGTGTMEGTVEQERYALSARAEGTLEKIAIDLEARGDKIDGQASIQATPFATLPFERLEVNASHVNPRAFSANAPKADLELHATLVPDAGAAVKDMPSARAAFPALNGSISLTNAQPGAIDADKLPLESASAVLHLDGRKQKLTQLQVKLSGGAALDGAGELQQDEAGKASSTGEFHFAVKALDLHALHGRLQQTGFNGPLNVKLLPGSQQVTLKLDDPRLSIALDAQIDPERVTLRSAQLSAGAARLGLAGTMSRDGNFIYALQGKLAQFDPGAWINLAGAKTTAAQPREGKKNRAIAESKPAKSAALASADKQRNNMHGRINMDFSVDGRVVPELQTALKFSLHDSEYGNLPMSGSGRIAISGKRLLPSELQLSAVGNELSLRGGFGRSDDRLEVKLNAPQLDRLGMGLSGSLGLDAEIRGTLTHPDLHAVYHAQQLMFGTQHLVAMSGQADIHGDLADSAHALANSRLSATVDLHDYAGTGIKLDHGVATLAGTYGNNTFTLTASGSVHDKPLALTLATQGRLAQLADGLHWDGTVEKFENRGLPQIAAAAPFALSVSPQRLVLGATKFSLLDTTLELKNFSYDHGALASEGSTGPVNLAKILALQQEFTGVASPIRTDLTFDARWKIASNGGADSFFDINRLGGDITVDPGRGDVAIGLSDLRLHATLHANRLKLDAQAAASRIGTLTLRAESALASKDASTGLNADQPYTAQLTLVVPNLKKMGALFGPRYAIDGSIKASLSGSGTLAEPTLSGTIDGDGLALTLYDQGIHLHDGIALLTLDKNVVTLQKLELHSGAGSLKAEGQVQVGASNPDLHARLVADHLQLFSSPDRELTLSGQASLASVSEQLHIDGKMLVNDALFDLPKSSAPQLGDDVVIVHSGGKVEVKQPANSQEKMAKTSNKPAGRFAPVVNLDIDLGDDFRFRGSGADLKLGGNLSVHSEPYQSLKATGTVQVVSGTYETFGRKLLIERGILNFQGPLDNPNIDILAMRRNQDVEAGVEVTGLARRPRTKLVSEPDVVDEEKLSWLMFGHGSESNGVGQQQAASAALGLLGNAGGKSLAKGIGLDTFSIGTSESGLSDQQVVNLGKAISEKFVVGYEQSLSGAASIAKLTWQVSRRWSVVLRAGAINGVDLLFSLRYD
jgi:translocation and assembly module TamB